MILTELINLLAKKYEAKYYLEIGVHAGKTLFEVDIPHKTAVDPDFQFDIRDHAQAAHFFPMPSDEFFALLPHPDLPAAWDIIFIDGLHTFEQSLRDFENSLAVAHENTIWILDDTLPCDPYSAIPHQATSYRYRKMAGVAGKPWHGDVFKTLFAIHDMHPEFSYCTPLMRGNPRTIVWRTPGQSRTPIFASLEEIGRLNYFDIFTYSHVFMPVTETESVFTMIGMPLNPAEYADPSTAEKLCTRWIRSEREMQYEAMLEALKQDKIQQEAVIEELRAQAGEVEALIAAEYHHYVDKRIAQEIGHTKYREAGEQFCLNGKLSICMFRDCPTVSFTEFTWENNLVPGDDGDWLCALNAFCFLPYLMAYHAGSGDESALEKARCLIQSWFAAYLHKESACRWVWHDHGTAVRTENLLLFVRYVQRYCPNWELRNHDFCSAVQEGCRVHARRLATEQFYTKRTNHGLIQMQALLMSGLAFSREQEGKEWLQLAQHRLMDELAFSFTREGVHIENSPAYHHFVLSIFLEIGSSYPPLILPGFLQNLSELVPKALEFLARILRPDGKFPIIGDTQLQVPKIPSLTPHQQQCHEFQELCFAHSLGEKGVKPTGLQRVYPEAGYGIFRDSWADAADYAQALHLVVKGGILTRYHSQEDEGHLVLYACGEDWLIDSGFYNYKEDDAVRLYMRSRQAHNVACVSGTAYGEGGIPSRISGWNVSAFDESMDNPFIELNLRVLEPIHQIRRVSYARKESIVTVRDEFTMLDGEEHDVTLLWHIPQDKRIVVSGRNSISVHSALGNTMTIAVFGDQPDSITVRSGTDEEHIVSCVSYSRNEYVDSQVVEVHFLKRKSLSTNCSFAIQALTRKEQGKATVFNGGLQ